MTFKKIFFLFFLIVPLVISGCSVPFGPKGSGGGQVSGSKGVFKSTDKGQSWTEKNIIIDNPSSLSAFNNHQLAFDVFDSNIIYRATNVGLFLSTDASDSWRMINGSNISAFVLSPKTRGIIYIAVGNQVFKTTDNGDNWDLVYQEGRRDINIVSLAISHFDSSYIYLLTTDGVVLKSGNWGESWQTIYQFERIKTKRLLLSPLNSDIMFVAAERHLYRSVDAGKSWTNLTEEIKNEYPGIDEFIDLKFTATSNDLLYLSKYGILKSPDNGARWQPISLISSPASVQITSFVFNPNNSGEIYYTLGNILYHTLDNGLNWKTKVVPVPSGAKVNELLVDPAASGILYLSVTQ